MSVFDYLDPSGMIPVQTKEQDRREDLDARWRTITGLGNRTQQVRNLLQGPSFGFSDEGLALGRHLSSGEPYGEALASEQRLLQEYANANPIMAPVEQFASAAVGPGLNSLKSFRALPWDWKAKALTAGAAEGAVAGAGTAEGDVWDRLRGAGLGAAFGAPLGLAGAGAAIAGANVLGRAADDLPSLFRGPRERAEQRLRGYAQEAGIDPAVARREAADLGPEGVLADVSGFDQFGEALGQKATQRAPIADVVYPRNQRQYERLLDGIRRIIDTPEGDYWPALRRLEKEQSAQAKVDYDVAYATEVPPTDEMFTILETPAGAKALNDAMRRFKNQPFEGRRLNDYFDIKLDADGNLVSFEVIKTPDMRAWDDIKRAFDDAIEANTTGDVFRRLNSDGRDLVNLKRRLVSALDAANPAYQTARMNYASAARLKEAADYGRVNFFKEDPDLLRMKVDEMSPAEYEAFKVGAYKAITKRLGGPSRRLDKTKRLDSPDIERAFQELLRRPGGNIDMARYQELGELISRERTMYSTAGRVLGGSPTDRREQARRFLSRTPAGNKERGYIARALDALFGEELPTDVLSELRLMMFSEDPGRVLTMLESIGVSPQRQQAFEHLVYGVLAPQAGHAAAVGGVVGGNTAFGQ